MIRFIFPYFSAGLLIFAGVLCAFSPADASPVKDYSVMVIKEIVGPYDGDESFTFKLEIPGLSDPTVNLGPGESSWQHVFNFSTRANNHNFVLSEIDLPQGWQLDGITNISGGNQVVKNIAGSRVSFRLTPGHPTFSATFVNSLEVPLPGAFWLLGSGLIGLVGIRRKLKR